MARTHIRICLKDGYNLSGTFPTQIANLRNLTSLSLRDNMFHGKLPSELATFSNLEILRLNRNGFTGTLPKEWLALTSLVHLDIAWNQLTGTLLSNIGSLQSLEKLWIDHNHFSGSVPAELSLLTNLRKSPFSPLFFQVTTSQIPSHQKLFFYFSVLFRANISRQQQVCWHYPKLGPNNRLAISRCLCEYATIGELA